MHKLTLFVLMALCVALPLAAQTAPANPPQQESLGDVARKMRQQEGKEAKTSQTVFTNDNLPAPIPWEAVNVGPSTPAEKTATESEMTGEKPGTDETAAKKTASSETKGVKDKNYWQGKFQAARDAVAKAKEEQQLSEDELNLLQIQQAQTLDPAAKEDLTSRMEAKQTQVDSNKAVTEAAQKTLDDLQQQFKDSGAPEEWSEPEPPPPPPAS